jgi:hypothetical protein
MKQQSSVLQAAQLDLEQAQLPDGIGMRIEDVRDQLIRLHDKKVSLDDPVLMVVTVLNAYLAENDRLYNRHNSALTAILSDRTDKYVKAVAQVNDELKQSLSASALTGFQLVCERFRIGAYWLVGIIGVSSLINVAVFVATYWH